MHSIGLVLKLKPNAYGEYKRRHDELWPEMSEMMTRLGISMAIYRFNDYLFVHGVADSAEAWTKCEMDPVTPRWNSYMADVLEVDDNGKIAEHPLPQVFTFGIYK